MGCKMEKDFNVPLSLCDNTSHLSISGMFNLFMDIATEHATELKLSASDLGENKFWLAIRTKVRVFDRPIMSQKIKLSTWPQKPSRIRANRHYTIERGNTLYVAGKTEWAVIDTATKKLQRLTDIYGEDFDFCEDDFCVENYARVDDDFENAKQIGEYIVKSIDIDLGQHMNNSAYIRAFFSMFSAQEIKRMNIKELDIAYKAQSFENEVLTIKEREAENATEYAMIKPDNTICATLRVVRND